MSGGENLLIGDLGALRQLDLSAFPAATDFVIELAADGGGSSVQFVEHGLNVIIEFPWWEDAKSEIAEWSLADIPSGSIDSPYWDMDQGWHVAIWQAGDLVYVAQGGETEGEYDRWFSVPSSIYRAEWEKVIRLASSGN